MDLPTETLPLRLLESVLEARPDDLKAAMSSQGEPLYWTRSISLGNDLDRGSQAYPMPGKQAHELFIALLERVVLWLRLPSDWPGGDDSWWPTTLAIEEGALLAVWDFDYYAVLVATRPQSDGTAFVELRVTSHAAITAQKPRAP